MTKLAGEAILLRAVDFGESDRIAHLLTPESGRVTVIAKGARRSFRRFPGTLDVFNHLRISGRPGRRGGMAFLEQAILISPFLPLRREMARFALAGYLVEILDRMAPESGTPAEARPLFDFALAALKTIERARPDRRLRLLIELRALDALGLCPELRRCVRCGRPPAVRAGFLVADGGVVCAQHALEVGAAALPVHLGTLRALQQALELDWSRLERLALGGQALAEAESLLFRFHRFHVGLELRSEGLLEESLRSGSLTPRAPRVDTPPLQGRPLGRPNT
ncbi:MAG: DNA repair protein RecO [Myxococcota bacterium]|nr:DNA repair protein RecO [Myxococcota bacterium]